MRPLYYLVASALLAALIPDPSELWRSSEQEHEYESESGEHEVAGQVPKGAALRWQQRAGADGKIPEGALYREARAHQARLAAMPAAATGPSNWTLLGPGNIGGRIRSIVIHPTTPATMWVGSVSGGVWKSTDAGASWKMLPDLPAVLAITCMVLDPSDPNTLYAGTGEQCFFNNVEGSSNSAVSIGAGVFKSSDGGNTWTQLASTAGPLWNSVSRLTIDKNNSSILVASTISGIWRTTDGGANWSQRTTTKTLDVEIDPNDSSKYVAGRPDGLAQYSTDGGVTWTNTATFPNVTRVEVKYAKVAPGTVYACTSVQGASLTLWRSTNGGQSYTLQSTGTIVSTLSNYDNTLWIDPTNANTVVVGGLDIYRSTNAGVSFTKVSNWSSYPNSAHADQHVMVEHPAFNGTTNTTVYFGNDGGIQRATNVYTVANTSGWTNVNNGLAITQFYGCCAHPTSGLVLGGAQDNGTSRGTATSGINGWTQPGGGDGSYCAVDWTTNYVYMQSQYIGLSRSSNSGSTSGSGITNGISDPTPNFMAYILLDPNESNRLYACGAQLWRTNNARGTTAWASIKPALLCPSSKSSTPPAHFDNNPPCNISTVAVARGNPNIIWVGHNNGHVYYTTNGLAVAPTWTKVDDNTPSLPDRWVSRISIDAFDHNKVTVSFLGFAQDNLWRTTNSGVSWSARWGTGANMLPAVPVACILQHRVIGSRYYTSTDLGLYFSEDDGLTWRPAVGGPSIVPIEEIIWKNDRTMVLATHGRSIWSCDVDPASVTPVGTGCGIAGPPSLTISAPAIGNPQVYTLASAAPNSAVSLLLAAGPASPTVVGPCVIQPSLVGWLALPFGTTTSAGGLIANLPIPADTTFLGVTLTVQEFIAVSGGPLLQLGELSNGAEMKLGF